MRPIIPGPDVTVMFSETTLTLEPPSFRPMPVPDAGNPLREGAGTRRPSPVTEGGFTARAGHGRGPVVRRRSIRRYYLAATLLVLGLAAPDRAILFYTF